MFCRSSILIFSLGILILFFLSGVATATPYENRWEKIIEENLEKVQKDPENPVYEFHLGVAYACTGEVEKTVDWFENFSENPRRREVSPKILADIEEKLREAPEDPVFLTQYSFALHVNYKYEESIDVFWQVLEYDEKNIWVYNYLAVAYLELEETEKAREVLDISLSIEENRYTRALLGYSYWMEGRYGRAMRHFVRTGTLMFRVMDLLE